VPKMVKLTAEKKMIEKKRKIKGQKDKDTSSDLIRGIRNQVGEGSDSFADAYEEFLENLPEELKELKNQRPYKQFSKVDKTYTAFSKELGKLIDILQ